MLTLLLFYQVFTIYAVNLTKSAKVTGNKSVALNDYPDYDSNIWGMGTVPSNRPLPAPEEFELPGRSRFGVKRYPQLIRNTENMGNPVKFPLPNGGYPDTAPSFRNFNGMGLGVARMRGRNQVQPIMNRNQNTAYQGYPSSPLGYSYAGYIDRQARRYPIMMYTLVQCVPCQRAKHLLAVSYSDVAAHFLELVGDEDWQRQLQVDLQQITGQVTFPYIFICGQHIGGYSDLFGLHQSGQLRTMLNNCAPRQ
ncbi:unnamed protein product [Auanema sp. JU1783]|nr:unnamed protein product [Auanema sp. JU1783]